MYKSESVHVVGLHYNKISNYNKRYLYDKVGGQGGPFPLPGKQN